MTEQAVAYYRMSTDRQDASIPEQRKAVEKLAKTDGFRLIGEYTDEGISGDSTEKRTAFKKMLADAQDGKFQAILCWDQDRFGRFDSIEMGHWIYPLRMAGVRLVTVAQGPIDWEEFSGRLIYTIQQEGKHQFLRDLSRNSLRGLIARAKRGQWSGQVPFGLHKADDGHLELGDPTEVEIVRRIFRLRLTRLGCRAIAKVLIADQIPAPNGGLWSPHTVREILYRETYIGTITLGKHNQGKYFTSSEGEIVRQTRRKTSQGTKIENCHPALIDPKTFAAVQAMRGDHLKPHWRAGSHGAPLAGLLYCDHCGKILYAQNLNRKNYRKFPNYICSTYHQGRGCGYYYVRQDAILRIVLKKVREEVLLGSCEALERAVKRSLGKLATAPPADEVRRRKRTELARIDRHIELATNRLVTVADSLVPDVSAKLIELKAAREALVNAVDSAKDAKQRDPLQIAAKIWQLVNVLKNGDPSEVRRTLSLFIEDVRLRWEPAGRTGRGMRYRFVGAVIRTKRLGQGALSLPHWKSRKFTITPEELGAA